MQNIDVRFNATSNFAKAKSDLAALEAQAASLNKMLSRAAYAQGANIISPGTWRQANSAVETASRTYRDAASSSGLFTTQQIRATSEAERYTEAIKKQKLGLMDMLKHRGIMKQVYQDQLRYQRMAVQQWGTDAQGRMITDVTIPKEAPKELDTMRRNMAQFGYNAMSAGRQITNLGKNIQWSGRQLTVGFTYPFALFGAAAGVMAFKTEDAFARINKVYDLSHKSIVNEAEATKELAQLREQSFAMATDVAQQYGKTLSSTLEIEQQLAATGLKGQSLLESTKEVQRISTLGDIDTTQTTDMVVALQTAFRKTIKNGEDMTNVLNFMNAASNATSLSLQDIAEATPRAASGIAQLGGTAQEMTVLLVSMRESGVDAATGANALKSATTRIINPVKKANEFYEKFGISLKELAMQSGGNLFKYLKLLGVEQQKINGRNAKQTALLRAQGVAALFGTYQNNRLTASLVNMADAYGGVQNQTAKALELMGKTPEELKKIADTSEKLMIDNPAGRFKQQWAQFQIELTKIGQPFLEAATSILGVFTKLAKAFNGLDDGKKRAALLILTFMALAGPLVMITGLFINMVGSMTSVIGIMARLVGWNGMVTKSEKMAALVADAQSKAMLESAQAQKAAGASAVTLAEEISVLTASYEAATVAATRAMAAMGRPAAAAPSAYSNVGAFSGVTGPVVTGGALNATAQSQTVANERLLLATTQQRSAEQANLARAQAQEAAAAGNTRRQMSGAAVSTGVMGASMVTMMATSNTTAQNIAKWALISSILVPAAKSLAAWTATTAANAQRAAVASAAQSAATSTATAATAAQAGIGARLLTGVRAAGAGFWAMTGPVGIIVGLLAAGGLALWAWKKHQKEIYEQQVEMQKALSKETENWASAAGKVVKQFKSIQAASVLGTPDNATPFQDRVAAYETGEQKPAVEAFKALNDEAKESAFITDKFIDLQNRMGLTANAAATEVQAWLVATGESFDSAGIKAKQLLSDIGTLQPSELTIDVQAKIDLLNFDNEETMKQSAEDLAKVWGDAYANADTPAQAQKLIAQLKTISDKGYDQIYNSLTEKGKERFAELGIDSVESFNSAIAAKGKGHLTVFSDMIATGDVEKFMRMANQASVEFDQIDRYIAKTIAHVNGLGDGYEHIRDVLRATRIEAKTFNREQAIAAATALAAQNDIMLSGSVGDIFGGRQTSDDLRTARINTIAMAQGIKQGATYSDTLLNLIHNVKVETKGASDEANDLSNNLNKIPHRITIDIQAQQVAGVVQEAMSSVQSDMAQSAQDTFDSGWDSRMDAAQSAWDRRMKAQQNAQERAMDAFDTRWEHRKDVVNNAYQAQIDAVQRASDAAQKADDLRQRLFDNEKTRLQQMADMQNQNIDFNTAIAEGRLDEAAKIQNNMQAQTASDQMDREIKAAEVRTQAKIDALERKAARLEKQRDKEIKALEKTEDRMRKHLEHIQQARADALQQQSEDELAAMERTRDAERAVLDQRLALFQAYTGRNQKDLERWMKEVGLSYDDFGIDVMAKGERWSTYFETSLRQHIREAGMKIAADNMWEQVGAAMANKLLKGIGFPSKAAFVNFVKTGELPAKFGQPVKPSGTAYSQPGGKHPEPETYHGGGRVGTGGSGRGNIPNTYKGLHRSEQMIRAQKGEYVVNRNASQRHGMLLEAINKGVLDPNTMGGYSGGSAGVGLGFSGVLMGAISQMLSIGMSKAFGTVVQNTLAKYAAMGPSGTFMGEAGKYGGIQFTEEQMKNAAIIASVGSGMGMSKRDIEIGIMTAITESSLRNISGGDRDSAGLFQQRPSQGWGTLAQVTNPKYAATKFFSVLKSVGNRDDMSPWMAAQTVQRSAFSDGSNYQRYWDAALAIFTQGLEKTGKNKYAATSGQYIPGAGGRHRPISAGVSSGIHDEYTGYPALDFAASTGHPVYAVADGVVSRSYDITGYEPRRDQYGKSQDGYRSYGRVVYLKTNAGPEVLYAHLSKRSVTPGQQVRGGAVLGYSGDTGNSTGPHLHFGSRGASPYAWLRKGGTIRYDNTPVIAHKGETMLSSTLTKQFKDNVAGGASTVYDIDIDLRGAYIKEEVDIKKAVWAAIDEKEKIIGRKRKVV